MDSFGESQAGHFLKLKWERRMFQLVAGGILLWLAYEYYPLDIVLEGNWSAYGFRAMLLFVLVPPLCLALLYTSLVALFFPNLLIAENRALRIGRFGKFTLFRSSNSLRLIQDAKHFIIIADGKKKWMRPASWYLMEDV